MRWTGRLDSLDCCTDARWTRGSHTGDCPPHRRSAVTGEQKKERLCWLAYWRRDPNFEGPRRIQVPGPAHENHTNLRPRTNAHAFTCICVHSFRHIYTQKKTYVHSYKQTHTHTQGTIRIMNDTSRTEPPKEAKSNCQGR